MLKADLPRTFPLHLAPIDDFFLLDDRADYPMTFVSHVFLQGELQKEAFLAALDDALEMHPLLRAFVGRAKGNMLCWIHPGKIKPPVYWIDGDESFALENSESIDLQREVGLRIWVRRFFERTEILFQYHHACCDGTGAHRFIGDLLAGYGIRTCSPDQRPPELPNYDPLSLRQRRSRLTSAFNTSSRPRLARVALREMCQIFGQRIAPLALPSQVKQPSGQFPGIISHVFSREETAALRVVAKQQGAMLNDLLLAEMFRCMQQWNEEHGEPSRRKLRIMMPSDMRDKRDFGMPAANMTTYNFITRSMEQCSSDEELIKSVRDEVMEIKHSQSGRRFIDAIMAAKRIPGLLPLLLSRTRCISTITVSNVGDPTKRFLATFPRKNGRIVCGDVTLERWQGVSPLRPHTHAAVCILSFYRELVINVRCDPNRMTNDDARKFLVAYVQQLLRHVEPVRETVSAAGSLVACGAARLMRH
jgi:NRPS condensation-like uncharacterized protein